MEMIKRLFVVALVAFACGFSAQAISIDDFYKYCSKIPNHTEVKIPKLMLKFANRHVSDLKILSVEELDDKTYGKTISELGKITVNEKTVVIKNNDDDEVSHVYIKPDGKKKVLILIASISPDECDVVYIKCDKKLLQEVLSDYDVKISS